RAQLWAIALRSPACFQCLLDVRPAVWQRQAVPVAEWTTGSDCWWLDARRTRDHCLRPPVAAQWRTQYGQQSHPIGRGFPRRLDRPTIAEGLKHRGRKLLEHGAN